MASLLPDPISVGTALSPDQLVSAVGRVQTLIARGAPPKRLQRQLAAASGSAGSALALLDELKFFSDVDEDITRLTRNRNFAMPAVRPMGRSYFTKEPERAAAVFLAAFGDAQIVPQNLSSAAVPHCANVTTIRRRTGETFTFVQDGRKPNPAPAFPTEMLLQRAQHSLRDVAARRALWSQFEDNHDGYGIADATDVSAVVDALGGGATWYWANETVLAHDQLLHGVFRFWVPGSLWTSELGMDGLATRLGPRADSAVRTLLRVQSDNPDTCRRPGLDWMYGHRNIMRFADPWFKATFASAVPAEAQQFAIDYLGAQSITSPYEEPGRGCHVAKWAVFVNRTQAAWEDAGSDGRTFMLHFVLSDDASFDTPSPTTRMLGDAVRAGRRLRDNVFDRYMYDALTLWVSDLKPFVDRLDAGRVPYLVRGWPSNGVAGVFVGVPGSEAVIELRSDTGIDPARIEPYDVCSDESLATIETML
jgi:hypothetical protein